MLEITHKIQAVLNELRGFEAGYSTTNMSVLFIRTLEDNKVYSVTLVLVGKSSEQDMMDNLDSLPNTKDINKFVFATMLKLSDLLGLFKDYEMSHTSRNKDTFFIDYKKEACYKAKITELDEGSIPEFFKFKAFR